MEEQTEAVLTSFRTSYEHKGCSPTGGAEMLSPRGSTAENLSVLPETPCQHPACPARSLPRDLLPSAGAAQGAGKGKEPLLASPCAGSNPGMVCSPDTSRFSGRR